MKLDPKPKVLDSRPGTFGRLLSRPVVWVGAVALLFVLPLASSLARELPKPPPKLLQLPSFQLTSEKNTAFGSEDLRGKVWVASFVFTSCPSVCPALMERLQKVQHRSR